MKKVLMLILIFTMLFTINAYAMPKLPDDLYVKFNEFNVGNTAFFYNKNSDFFVLVSVDNIRDRVVYRPDFGCFPVGYSRQSLYYDNKWHDTINSPGTYSGVDYYTSSYDLLYVNYDVVFKGTSDVFFSKKSPPEIPILTQATQAVGMKSLEEMSHLSPMIAVLLVGSVALWKGWSALKTTLSGA